MTSTPPYKSKLEGSNFFVGRENWVNKDKLNDESSDKATIEKISLYLKKYLLLDNVNFLFGTGSSIHLGASTIQTIPPQVVEKIKSENLVDIFEKVKSKFEDKSLLDLTQDYKNKKLSKELDIEQYQEYLDKSLSGSFTKYLHEHVEDSDKNTFEISDFLKFYDIGSEEFNKTIRVLIEVKLEDFINYLMATKFILEQSEGIVENSIRLEELNKLISTIKIAMFEMCDLDEIKFEENKFLLERDPDGIYKEKLGKEGKYTYHKSFLKSILQRPLNLRRANIFTLNYDLAFENTFDELGIHYIDGFSGFHKRSFRPEVYNYDYFYPGDTTEGQVRRIERVVKYYKLHGSLTWINDKNSGSNPFGLYEEPMEFVRQAVNNGDESKVGNIMIYPTSAKKEYTLNFPYSEPFRKFADRLSQPETVLFCIGYSFYDEHINDIIYQAMASPTFTLIIVDFKGSSNGGEIKRLKELEDPRIIILEGSFLGDFKAFSKEILPQIDEFDTRSSVAKTLKQLFDREKSIKTDEEDDK